MTNNEFRLGDYVDVNSKYMEKFQGVIVGISQNDDPGFEPFGTVYEIFDIDVPRGMTYYCAVEELSICMNPRCD